MHYWKYRKQLIKNCYLRCYKLQNIFQFTVLSRTPYAKRTHQKQRKRAWKEQQFGSPYGFQLVWVQWVQHFHCHKITNTLVQIGLAK
jgi:hypothetical protein